MKSKKVVTKATRPAVSGKIVVKSPVKAAAPVSLKSLSRSDGGGATVGR